MKSAFVPRVNLQRTGLKQRFLSAWSRTDEFFGLVKESAFLAKPIVWRHPFVFYVGHLPAFSWNQICGGILNWKSLNARFDDLFCRGIDPDVDTGECHWHPEVPEEWPALKAVFDYRDKVRASILESLDAVPRSHSEDVMAQNDRVFEMVLEHEYMHQETLLYMVQELPRNQKNRPAGAPRYRFQTAAPSRRVEIPSGTARMGAQFEELNFGWDNEFPEFGAEVPGFTIDSLPVTNGEFLEFVESGGYEQERYWRPEDRSWKNLTGRRHPDSWLKRADAWFYRALFDVLPLAQVSGWPVYVSLAEARAYASWRGERLPTEAEFHRVAFGGPGGGETRYPWGDRSPESRHGNFDFTAWSPAPVGCHPAGSSRWGVGELIGNGWEWTDTPFAPFPGFTPYMNGYPDYSKDFFDGKHFVLKGASWATARELVRPTFRNWYQAHYPYVFAKFRCVSDDQVGDLTNPYPSAPSCK
jgi:ergothioneine biosynthesis protein EgtB